MGLETRVCNCGQEFETSEWVASRECPDCVTPAPALSNSILSGSWIQQETLNQLRQTARRLTAQQQMQSGYNWAAASEGPPIVTSSNTITWSTPGNYSFYTTDIPTTDEAVYRQWNPTAEDAMPPLPEPEPTPPARWRWIPMEPDTDRPF